MSDRVPRIALVGNPNCGKTTLFGAMTGLSARTGNYPGTTVEHRVGVCLEGERTAELIDLPGTYAMRPAADDEAVAVAVALGRREGAPAPDLVVAVCDATRLERSLYIVVEMLDLGLRPFVVLTMGDMLPASSPLDASLLAKRLDLPVTLVSGKNAKQVQSLRAALVDAAHEALRGNGDSARPATPESAAGALVPPTGELGPAEREALAAQQAAATERYQRVEQLCAGLLPEPVGAGSTDPRSAPQPSPTSDSDSAEAAGSSTAEPAFEHTPTGPRRGSASTEELRTDALDRLALHPVAGPLALMLIFGVVFEALFTWSGPFMDLIEQGMGSVGGAVRALVPESLPLLRSLLVDGVVAGVGNVLVFVPQIGALFFFLSLLEDSGYLARAAFILDRLMSKVGLSGRAFIPLLSGFACAVPALMATRSIGNERDRLTTILVTPLTSCSARLPVYVLVLTALFSDAAPVLGVLHIGTVLLFSLYLLGIVVAIAVAAVLRRTLLPGPPPSMVLELPPYRVPVLKTVVRRIVDRVKVFIVDAGTIILAVTVLLWGLFTFPRDEAIDARLQTALAELDADTRNDELPDATSRADKDRLAQKAALEGAAAKERLAHSLGGRMGHAFEPLIAPLGFNWEMGVAILASFAAREVFVSSLGLVYGLAEADESSMALREVLRTRKRDDGTPLYTPRVGLSLMVFFALAMQCMSTLAATRRETRSYRWPAFQFAYMTVLAWVGAWAVYAVSGWLGL